MKQCDNLLLIQYPGLAKPFTRPGCQLYSSAAPQIPAGAQRISTSFIYRDILHLQSSQKLYWFNAGAWTTANGPTGNNAFNNNVDVTTTFTYAHWNNHTLMAHSGLWYPQKVYINASSVPTVVEAGLPKFTGAPTITPGAGANNWLYRLVYRYSYTTKGTLTFTDYGTPSDIYTPVAGGLNVAFTAIPVLSNGATHNWDTSAIKVEIYRTTNNGTVFYKAGEVTNGTTVFTDSVSDATLVSNQLLYTEGGVVAADQPPRAKSVHIFGDIAYYGNVIDSTGDILPYRLVQAIPGDIDGVPETFFVDCDDDIVAVSSTKSNSVLLCKKSVYRVDGFYDEVGRGGMTLERISDTATCVSAQSAVQTLDGVFWAGYDGIYFTDGFSVIKLNADYDKTWATFVTSVTKQSRIQGKYDRRKNRIWWSVQDASGTDVNKSYILDLNWGVRENATFITASGLDSWSPTSIEFDTTGNLIRCDRRGYILYHTENNYSDLKIDTAVAATSWVKQTIFWTLESVAYNFGTAFARKWVTGINIVADSVTNLSLQIVSNNDDSKAVGNLSPIRYRGAVIWGDADIYWGDPSIIWNQDGLIAEKRRMPATQLRCSYKIVKFQNAFISIINSDNLGTAAIDAVGKTVTLNNAVGVDWPTNSIDWYIAFDQDNYTREYLITARSDDVLTYQDISNTTTSMAASEWVLRGYPKDEILNLINYSIHYDIIGRTQNVFKNSDSGEVGS